MLIRFNAVQNVTSMTDVEVSRQLIFNGTSMRIKFFLSLYQLEILIHHCIT